MNIPFPFDPLLCFGWLSIMLLAGVMLRATIPFFQKFLFPGCLIGGILGLILVHLGVIKLSIGMLETFAYHLFIISFISLGLTPSEKSGSGQGASKEIAKGGLWMALIEGVTLPLQAIIGGLVVIGLKLFGQNLFPTFGFLVPLGFTEGPGQALSIGKVWEGFGFQYAATIGLTFAVAGYLVAVFLGVPLANRGVRRGRATYVPKALPLDFIRGVIGKGERREPAGYQTTNSSNVDTLALHIALVGLVYILTYSLIKFICGLLSPDLADMLWGFFFFAGLLVALLVRVVMTALKINHTVDAGVQRRVTGWAVDFLIVATTMAIQLVVVKEYIVPISIMIVLATVGTTWIVFYLGKSLRVNRLERTLAIFGTCTGTVPTGLLLLRVVDPDFKTGAALELGFMNVFAAPIILGSMLLLNAPVVRDWTLELTMLVFAAILAASLLGLKLLTTLGAPKGEEQSGTALPAARQR